MRPTTALRENLREFNDMVDKLLAKKGASIKNGLQEGDCAKIVRAAARMKDPLDGQEPSPIPPVRRVFSCTMLRLVDRKPGQTEHVAGTQ